jgi:TfoX/Sxy family transcriptional regulator of competence genes
VKAAEIGEAASMPIDEVLAARVRSELTDRTEITERRMFGGLAFLANGQILVAVSRTGSLLVRLESAQRRDALLGQPHVTPMIMGARVVERFVYVDPAALASTAQLKEWITRGWTALAASAAKRPPARKRKPARSRPVTASRR